MEDCPERAISSGAPAVRRGANSASALACTGAQVTPLKALQKGSAPRQVRAGSEQVNALTCATHIPSLSDKHAKYGTGSACRLCCLPPRVLQMLQSAIAGMYPSRPLKSQQTLTSLSSCERLRLAIKQVSALQICLAGCLTKPSWAGKVHHLMLAAEGYLALVWQQNMQTTLTADPELYLMAQLQPATSSTRRTSKAQWQWPSQQPLPNSMADLPLTLNRFFWRSSCLSGSLIRLSRAGRLPPACSDW